MTQKDHEIGLLIKKAIHQEMENTPPPMPTDEAWKQLESKLHSRQVRTGRFMFFRNRVFFAAAAILISLIVFSSPQNSGAYHAIVEVFQKVQENVTQLFIKVGHNDPSGADVPLKDDVHILDDSEIIAVELSFENAQEETRFNIAKPKVVPKGYILENVTVYKGEQTKSDDIMLNYVGTEGFFTIEQKVLNELFSMGLTVDKESPIDSIDIHGSKASLLQYQEGLLELIWVTENRYMSIIGTLTEEEIIEMARSM